MDTEADPWDLLGAPNMVTTMRVLEGLAACAVFVDGHDGVTTKNLFDLIPFLISGCFKVLLGGE